MYDILRSAVIFVCLSITGCVPMAGSYYSPSGNYGIPVSEYCHGGIGAKNSMDMKFAGMEMVLSADRVGSTKTFIGLQIFGNANSTERFEPDNISVYDEDNHTVLPKENIKRVYSKVQANYSAYSFNINAAPKNFVITFPPVPYDGKQYGNLTVRFTRKHGMWVDAINC